LFSNLPKINRLKRILKSFEEKPFIISELMNINKVLNLDFSGN
jgi:hypothetical protein